MKNEDSSRTTFLEAIQDTYLEEFSRNKKLVLLGESVKYGLKPTLESLEKMFPERVINHIPLVEEMLGGIGVGMAEGGLRPVVQLNWSAFTTLLFDQIYRAGAWKYFTLEGRNIGITIRVGHDGYNSYDIGSELSNLLLGVVAHIPGMVIATPSNGYFARGLLRTSLRTDTPVFFLEHKKLYGHECEIDTQGYSIPFGSASVERMGNDLTIVTWLYTTELALKAASILEEEGVNTSVIALQTLVPFDIASVCNVVSKSKKLIVVEEEMERGGYAAYVAARIAKEIPGVTVEILGGKNVPLSNSSYHNRRLVPDLRDIIDAARRVCRRKRRSYFFRN